jgi:hypothetical protein
MQPLYRITTATDKPEHFASLYGAADRWREVHGKAVVEQVLANDVVVRRVPESEIASLLDRLRNQTAE